MIQTAHLVIYSPYSRVLKGKNEKNLEDMQDQLDIDISDINTNELTDSDEDNNIVTSVSDLE